MYSFCYMLILMLITVQVILFTKIRKIFCHFAIYVPYSNVIGHAVFVKLSEIWMSNGFKLTYISYNINCLLILYLLYICDVTCILECMCVGFFLCIVGQ